MTVRFVVDPFGTATFDVDPRHGWRVVDRAPQKNPIIAVFRTAGEAEAMADLLNANTYLPTDFKG